MKLLQCDKMYLCVIQNGKKGQNETFLTQYLRRQIKHDY